MVGWSSFPLEADVPMSDVIRTGEPLFFASAKERNERYPGVRRTGPGQSRARGRAARRRGSRLRRDVALLRPRRRVRARAAPDEADPRAPGRPGAGPLAPLRGRADAARADDLPRRGERAARLVARLQPHAQTGGAAQRPGPRRLVRDRHGRTGRRDPAARGRARGPRQGALGLRAAGAIPARPRRADRRAAGAAHRRARVLPRAPAGAAGRGDRRRRGAAPDHRRARAEIDHLRAARRARPYAWAR